MGYLNKFNAGAINIILIWLYTLVRGVTSDACSYTAGHQTSYVYCEHGCCGTQSKRTCCSYTISTSVLVVACVVSGLVVVALIASVVICCYKSYKDKQQSRVRAIRNEQARNAPLRPAEPPKPPSYIESPPDYSEEMPDSHYRPRTAMNANLANISYNTRFNGSQGSQGTTNGRNTQTSGIGAAPVYMTRASGTYRQSSEQLPGSIDDLPPRYSSLERGQSSLLTNNINFTNNRHRRFVRTPDQEVRNNATIEEEDSMVSSRNGTVSTVTRDSSTVAESRAQTRGVSRIPQSTQNLQSGRQSSAMSVASSGRSRMVTRSTANAERNRNTTISEVEDSEINELAAI